VVVHATNALGLLFGFREGGDQHCGENSDDGNHHQKFNQCEAYVALAVRTNRPIF
jgi:hypothetical protein